MSKILDKNREKKISFFQKALCKTKGVQAGFTLIEIIIVIALIGFAYTVALPNFSVKTGAELEILLGRIASDVRSAYDRAILSKKHHRIIFDLKAGKYWLEETDRRIIRKQYPGLDRDPNKQEIEEILYQFEEDFINYKELAGEEIKDSKGNKDISLSSPVLKAKKKLAPVKWRRVKSLEWQERSLDAALRFSKIQAEHHRRAVVIEDPEVGATAALYFHPSGVVEKAVIYLSKYSDQHEEFTSTSVLYTIEISPFDGTANIQSGYKEVNINDEFI